MTVAELIEELKSYDSTVEVVTSDGYGSIDPLLKVSIERINDRDDIVTVDFLDSHQECVVLGWNH
jgi:hypothetical protein